jgi:Raf kinase inhibitor-like YbhB/YbcL family protein
MRIEVSSPAFENDQSMPKRFAAEGGNVSPPVRWGPLPSGTRSLVLIVEDIDLPLPKFLLASWVHWIIYNIPADSEGIPEGMAVGKPMTGGGTLGWTSFRRFGWGGPAPVGGEHRYVFRLYALDTALDIPARTATRKVLSRSMAGHILGQGELVGRYARR